MTPIQIVDGDIMIPIEYVGDAREFVVEVDDDVVWVRPKLNGANGSHQQSLPIKEKDASGQDDQEDFAVVTARLREKYPWIGMAEKMDPDTSTRAEEILSAEVDKRAGWTMKPHLEK